MGQEVIFQKEEQRSDLNAAHSQITGQRGGSELQMNVKVTARKPSVPGILMAPDGAYRGGTEIRTHPSLIGQIPSQLLHGGLTG